MKKRNAAFVFLILLLTLLLLGCGVPSAAAPPEAIPENAAPQPPTEEFFPPVLEEPSGEDLKKEEISDAPTPEIAPQEKPDEYAPYIAACASANVNVRSGVGTNHNILFTLKKGDSLPFLEKTGNWLAVQTQSGVGYVYGSYAYLAKTCLALENVIRAGLKKIGTPYEWGAPRVLTDNGVVSPYFTGNSFDCSSFVQYCYYVGCGVKLGNYTGSQADHTVGEIITSYDALERGDFYFTGTGKISHVVIYLGNGLLLQTYSANGGPVSVTSDERWKPKFLSGRRPDLHVIDQYK